MSDDLGELPPRTAPLKLKITAAMRLSADYGSQRALADALGTNGSLVGKWMRGKVKRITSVRHRRKLPELLNTPRGYFDPAPEADVIERLAEEADANTESIAALWEMVVLLHGQVRALGGSVPDLPPIAFERADGDTDL